VGETPNLAARLQGIAEPNSVVIAESTRKLLGNLFELEDLGARGLKGVAGPVRAWTALRPSGGDLPISTDQRTTTCRPVVDEERNRDLIPETHYLRSKIPDHEDRFIECPGALGLCGFAGLQADQSLRLAGRKNQRRPASPRRHSSATSFAPSRGPRRSFRTATITISRREPVSLHFRRAHDG
jgi:hypothetical protein